MLLQDRWSDIYGVTRLRGQVELLNVDTVSLTAVDAMYSNRHWSRRYERAVVVLDSTLYIGERGFDPIIGLAAVLGVVAMGGVLYVLVRLLGFASGQ